MVLSSLMALARIGFALRPQPHRKIAVAPGVVWPVAQLARGLAMRDERHEALQAGLQRHRWEGAANERGRCRSGTGRGAVDLKNAVRDLVVLNSQPEGLSRITGIGDGPQEVLRRRRAGHRPDGRLVRLKAMAIALLPQILHGAFGPTRADGHPSALPIEIPVGLNAQTNGLDAVRRGITLADEIRHQFALT